MSILHHNMDSFLLIGYVLLGQGIWLVSDLAYGLSLEIYPTLIWCLVA